jgi:SepF-like predicted cell division protein (DUF552 family)
MALNWLLGTPKTSRDYDSEDDEYVELDAITDDGERNVKIRVATLNEFGDVERVQTLLRENNIVWVKIKPLKDKDMTDLKRAIDRLKKTISAINGDIAGIDEDWIVACPSFARVHR